MTLRDERGRFAKTKESIPETKSRIFHHCEDLMGWGQNRIVRITDERDLLVLTRNGGGCSRDHWPWVCVADPPCEYFFVLETEGRVSTILFCKDQRWRSKKHPQEAKLIAKYRGTGRRIPYTSDYYDKGWEKEGPKDYYLEAAENQLRYAQQDYDRIKAYALSYGPLGKSNPHKDRVDYANKQLTHCRGALEKAKLGRRVYGGMTFFYRGVELFIVQVSGRGLDYNGSNTRHTDRILEWMEKERA